VESSWEGRNAPRARAGDRRSGSYFLCWWLAGQDKSLQRSCLHKRVLNAPGACEEWDAVTAGAARAAGEASLQETARTRDVGGDPRALTRGWLWWEGAVLPLLSLLTAESLKQGPCVLLQLGLMQVRGSHGPALHSPSFARRAEIWRSVQAASPQRPCGQG